MIGLSGGGERRWKTAPFLGKSFLTRSLGSGAIVFRRGGACGDCEGRGKEDDRETAVIYYGGGVTEHKNCTK